ncbi:MAG TPA: FAD-dependent oxidoreductase [Actinomycetes bacterium]|nr:FAD-dependent oxidoreductase [Actinomycetes bacterium]
MTSPRVVVVGAGIIGLTSAIRIAEAGHDVAVLARDLPLETTSALAAALWYPYSAQPPDRVLGWAKQTLSTLVAESADPDAGIRVMDGLELRAEAGEPWFMSALTAEVGFAHFREVPAGYADGWQMRLPVVEPSIYLPWLVKRLEGLGGTITRTAINSLPDDALVVNCTGLAARSIADDDAVTPARGQILRISPIAGVDAWLLDHTEEETPVYVIPRSRDIVVGGTATVGSFDTQPNEFDATGILERAIRLVPALADATVVSTVAGLRPTRRAVRLETEARSGGGHVIHNYGHGGAGWTLAWGCAAEVVQELEQLTSRISLPG